MDDEFTLRTDSSDTAIGCLFLQEENGMKENIPWKNENV